MLQFTDEEIKCIRICLKAAQLAVDPTLEFPDDPATTL